MEYPNGTCNRRLCLSNQINLTLSMTCRCNILSHLCMKLILNKIYGNIAPWESIHSVQFTVNTASLTYFLRRFLWKEGFILLNTSFSQADIGICAKFSWNTLFSYLKPMFVFLRCKSHPSYALMQQPWNNMIGFYSDLFLQQNKLSWESFGMIWQDIYISG